MSAAHAVPAAAATAPGTPAGPRPISLDEIVRTLTDEAERIEGVQRALVEAAMRSAPDPGMMRRAKVYDMAADMLHRLRPHQNEIRKMLTTTRAAG